MYVTYSAYVRSCCILSSCVQNVPKRIKCELLVKRPIYLWGNAFTYTLLFLLEYQAHLERGETRHYKSIVCATHETHFNAYRMYCASTHRSNAECNIV